MQPEQIEEHQATRTELWLAACQDELTIEELYEELAKLRRLVGPALYDRRPRAKYR